VKGLAIEFKVRGAVWEWQRRVGGTNRTIKIGGFPAIGVADARAKASAFNEDLANGVDVYRVHGVGALAVDPSKPIRGQMTCTDAWDKHLARSTNKESTKTDKRGFWKNHWRDTIGAKLVTDVTYDDLMDVIEDLREEGKDGAADTATRYVKKFFSWCEANPRLTGLHETPARKLKPQAVTKRTRFLNDQEIRWFWDAVGELTPVWRDFFLTLLLTGQRRSEVRLLARVEVEDGFLNLPPARMKNNERHLLPTGPLAWRLISDRLASHTSMFVFQSPVSIDDDAAIGGLSKSMKKLRELIEKKANDAGLTVERWTVHDLRRTFATGAANIRGADERRVLEGEHIERTLSHKIGGVEAHYNHSDYFPDKRFVLTTWENRLREIVGSDAFENY
jgi:integrase